MTDSRTDQAAGQPAAQPAAPSATQFSAQSAAVPSTSAPLARHASGDQELQLQGIIELREERLIVEKEQEVAGTVTFTREVRRETVQLPVELVTEVLVIEHLGSGAAGGEHAVMLGDALLAPGERRELLIYREEARVEKRVVLSEQVRVSKRQIIETRTFDATLSREELVVNPQGDVRVTEQPLPAQSLTEPPLEAPPSDEPSR